ncbi:MAG: hypothetical protein IM638_04035 [Bacteroidetes bacterium]|nr:hypothetical protein [Bacteroidota bacterium]
MKKLLLLTSCLILLAAAGCGESSRKKSPPDSLAADTTAGRGCPPETAMDQIQTIEVKYEGDCQYCSFIIENSKPILLVKGKVTRIDAAIGGNEICTLFRVNTGQGLFRGFITINGKTQFVEQEISEMLEQVQRSFSFADFGITPAQPHTTDPNTTP